MEDITWELKNLDSLKEYIFDELIGEHKNKKDINEAINKYAESYSEMKIKLLGIANVSKCADEVIRYIENDAEIAMPVNELMHEDGRHLTKKEYGDVLLKYLIQELRERF
ncbi:hypothetical protein ACJRPK_13710 [Aquimarina sp. 2-A2]|uniref:hypothetical protein n=1 Tax=Aquimarina sp. 2-A2 TaxID=3382644 RepID=UPI00387EF279